jgi:anti-sigma factor RsiW
VKSCPPSDRLQALLDDELGAEDTAALRAHVEGCAACAAELAAYRDLFATLRSAPELEAPWGLRERILERVLPSRIRRRWITAFGRVYAGATAVVTFAALTAISRPETRDAIRQWAGDLAHATVRLLVLALDSVAVSLTRLPDGVRDLESLGRKLTPLSRALEQSFALPAVQVSVVAALIACVALFNWMRAHERRSGKGGPHGGFMLA